MPHVQNVEHKKIAEPMDVANVEDVVEQVSKAMKQCEITDIDADDYGNPQLCAEYANEIYRYLLKYEVKYVMGFLN